MTPDEARQYVSSNHRAVLVTRRRTGGLQTSPVTAGIDGAGFLVISSRESAFKTKNLRRDPRATVCVFSDRFYGDDWVQIDGTTQIVTLPEALEPLVDYYRRIRGDHPDWDEYRRAMVEQQRVLLRITFDRVGPTHKG